jgi:excisionase family DNA binding protein
MQDGQQVYFNTEEAAAYLGIKERKLYELVAQAAVPCSKVTGKWLFPRAALDRWVESGLTRPAGMSPLPPPAIIGGSHDPLLEWAARRSGCGLALLSEGSGSGLSRLGADEVAMAAIHMHGHEDGVDANLAALQTAPRLHDGVLVAFARREQGLLVAPGNPLGLATLADAVARQARFGLRQPGAGAQQLLLLLLAEAGFSPTALHVPAAPFATGQDLAFAIRAGEVDAGIATRAVALAQGLGFVPLLWEHFDLAMRRRTYFEPGPQRLLALLRSPEFHRQAGQMGGYDTGAAGDIRLNR